MEEIPGGQTTGRWDENQLPWLVGGLGPSWFGFRLDPFMKGICYLEISTKNPKPPGPKPPIKHSLRKQTL